MEPLGSPPTQPGSPAHIEEPALRTVASLADLPLRRGKWTPEEQNFSEVLIQAFLAGLVPDCADGTTLRAFLSRRLHCAPMRITKKFAGATLGKSIFSRTGQLDAGDAANLRRLESLFVRAEETNSAEAVFFAMRGRAHRDGAPPAGRAARAARRARGPDALRTGRKMRWPVCGAMRRPRGPRWPRLKASPPRRRRPRCRASRRARRRRPSTPGLRARGRVCRPDDGG